MRTIYGAVLVAALVAVPVAAQQPGQPGAGMGRGAHGGMMQKGDRVPFQGLLRFRSQLNLSEAQVAKIQQTGRELDAQNKPLRDKVHAYMQANPQQMQAHRQEMRQQMQQLRQMTPEQRRAAMEARRQEGGWAEKNAPAELKPAVEQIRANHKRAYDQVQAVLTPAQREQWAQLQQQGRNAGMQRGGRGRGMHRGMGPGQGFRGI